MNPLLLPMLSRDYNLPVRRVKVLCFKQVFSRPHKSPEQLERACRRTLEDAGFKRKIHVVTPDSDSRVSAG